MQPDARDDAEGPDAGPDGLDPGLLDQAFRLLSPGRRRDPRGKGRGEEPGYTPYIALNHDDPVAPTGVFYLSPDLWVISSRGMNLPVEGEPNQVFARVRNRGLMDAEGVTVRFYWADPSAAITDATAHPIGGSLAGATQGGVFIQAAAPGIDSTVDVPCPVPWFPDPGIAHACLLAKAWCPGFDPNSIPYEPALEPVNDRHSAQHNVNVEMVPPGGAYRLEVEVANISGFTQRLRLLVQALDFKQAVGRLTALQVPLRDELLETGRGFPLEVGLSEKRSFVHRGHAAFARLLLAADDPAAREGAPPGEGPREGGPRDGGRRDARAVDGRTTLADIVTEPFAPWEQRHLALGLSVPEWARPGEVFGFEVTQYLGEIATGGYVALIVVGKG